MVATRSHFEAAQNFSSAIKDGRRPSFSQLQTVDRESPAASAAFTGFPSKHSSRAARIPNMSEDPVMALACVWLRATNLPTCSATDTSSGVAASAAQDAWHLKPTLPQEEQTP
ncbi:hypothetical protein [Roseateles sp.]|uniref:hypothetical protein n=1 Tax=Roseateles sp. TaxID=1971397 RepID=UPI0031DCA1AA